MQFRVLGPLEVRDGDAELLVSGAKQRALLAMLLLNANEVVPVQRLIDELWGEHPPETAAKSLQIYVSRLRKALRVNGDSAESANDDGGVIDGDVVVTRARGYMVRVAAGELDLERFQALLSAGEAALREGDPATAADRLSEGLSLWRGAPLSDVELASVGRGEIERLDELRLRAHEQRIEARLAQGRHAELIGELEALIGEHPLRERPRGQLMLALYRCGRQAEALEQYRRARSTLVEQLGLEPGVALQQLQQAILRHDPALEAPRVERAPAAAAARAQQRRGVAVIAAGVLAVAVAGAVVTATGGDGPALRAEPNSVAVIDMRTNRLVDQFPVGTDPGEVSAGAGSLWVANRGDATVAKLDARERRVERTIAPGTAVDGMAAGEGAVWTTDSRRGLVARIDRALLWVERSIPIGGGGAYWTGAAPVATGAGSVWAAGSDDLVMRIDPMRRRVRARINVGNDPNAIAVGEGGVWVADGTDDTLTRIDPSTESVVTTIPVGPGIGGIAAGAGGVWVAKTLDNALVRIDPDTNAVTSTIRVGRAPGGVAIGAGAVWVANGGSGTVSRVDPKTERVIATIPVGQSPRGLAVADGALWVTVQARPAAPRPAARREPATARIFLADTDQPTDPAIAPVFTIGYATGALLLNYPDRPLPDGARLQPEIARAMPQVSDGGRTYTYRLRPGFRFSPPSGRPVTAAAFKRAIERALSPRTDSYAAVLVDDIIGLRAYQAGRARGIAGVIADRDTLTIRLTRPSATLPARLAMPYFSAVPPDTPIDPAGINGIPSAGPYYLASKHGGELVLKPNPHYGGERPHRMREIRLGPRPPQPQAITQVTAGETDALKLTPDDGGAAARVRLQARYGPDSTAAHAGQQRYFSAPTQVLHYLALNTRRAPFSSARLRRAVNYAIDRPALAAVAPPSTFGRPTDQYIPPAMPGFADANLYPLGGPDTATARRLAGPRHRHAVIYTCKEFPACQHNAAVVRQNLRAIGIDVEIRQFSYDALDRRLRRPGEPWDITDTGWGADYADPADFTKPILGKVTQAPIPLSSINYGGFANPRFQHRIQTLDRLTGGRRYRAYAHLDADLARQAAPIAAYATNTTDYFFSARIGCQTIHPVYGLDLAALCERQ